MGLISEKAEVLQAELNEGVKIASSGSLVHECSLIGIF